MLAAQNYLKPMILPATLYMSGYVWMTTTIMMQVSLDPEVDNTNLKIGPKNTMEIAILNDDDPGW